MHHIDRLIGNPTNKWSDFWLIFLLISSIVGFLTIKKWMNICFFLLFILSIFNFKKSFLNLREIGFNKNVVYVVIIFSLPILAILISQFGRDSWLFRAYDGPSRIFLSIPIFFFFIYKRVNFSQLIGITAPMTMILTLSVIWMDPESVSKWGGRYATSFVDPNTLGTYSLLFSSFCLLNMDFNFKSPKLWYLYQFIGLLAGFILIIGNGTRGSWLAIPVVLLLWLFFNYKKINKLSFLVAVSLIVIFQAFILSHFPNSLDRLEKVFSILTDQGSIDELDVGFHLRIFMWETGWEFFSQRPLLGFGDHNLPPLTGEVLARQNMLSPIITLNTHGPHNELLANGLRSGILGVISILGLFIVPLVIFIKHFNHNDESISRAAKLGIIYITCVAICSFTLEVFSLIYANSFYGFIVSGLIAQVLISRTKLTKI